MFLKRHKKLFFILGIFFFLIPVGLLSEYPAWGEWDVDFFKESLGFIPEGIKKSTNSINLIPDYSINGLNDVISYYISAIVGVALIFLFFWGLKVVLKNER